MIRPLIARIDKDVQIGKTNYEKGVIIEVVSEGIVYNMDKEPCYVCSDDEGKHILMPMSYLVFDKEEELSYRETSRQFRIMTALLSNVKVPYALLSDDEIYCITSNVKMLTAKMLEVYYDEML